MFEDLIKKLTAQNPNQGNSYILDWDIHRAIGYEHVMIGYFPVWRNKEAQWPATSDSVPSYTESINLALSLLPKDCFWSIESRTEYDERPTVRVAYGIDYDIEAVAATPPLAICLAAFLIKDLLLKNGE